MNKRTFIKLTTAAAASTIVPASSGMAIFDDPIMPDGFVKSYLWWAMRFSPSREDKILPCGFPEMIQTEKDIHPDAMKRIEFECQEFWGRVRAVLKQTYGKVNRHPSADSHERHATGGGGDFYWARQVDGFFLDHWPENGRQEFMQQAQKFCPMFLGRRQENDDGMLHFFEDPERWWYHEQKRLQEEHMEAIGWNKRFKKASA